MLAVGGAARACCVHGYGIGVLTQPWNPYLPLLFWVVVLLATWSVLRRRSRDARRRRGRRLAVRADAPAVPRPRARASVRGLRRLDPSSTRSATRRTAAQRGDWIARAVAVAAVLWIPVVDRRGAQDAGQPLELRDYFGDPPEAAGRPRRRRPARCSATSTWSASGATSLGSRVATAARSSNAAVTSTAASSPASSSSLVWLGSVVVAWRMRHRRLLALARGGRRGARSSATISMSRIFGKVWFYLTLWAWPTWCCSWSRSCCGPRSACGALGGRRPQRAADRAARPALADRRRDGGCGRLPAVAGRRRPRGRAGGAPLDDARARSSVRPPMRSTPAPARPPAGTGGTSCAFSDAMWFGSQAYGLVSELERRGFDVGMDEHVPRADHAAARRRRPRTRPPRSASRRASSSSGGGPSPASRRSRPSTRATTRSWTSTTGWTSSCATGSTALGLGRPASRPSTRTCSGSRSTRGCPPALQAIVDRMLHLGQLEAVFIVPPGTPPPS